MDWIHAWGYLLIHITNCTKGYMMRDVTIDFLVCILHLNTKKNDVFRIIHILVQGIIHCICKTQAKMQVANNLLYYKSDKVYLFLEWQGK